MVNDLLVRCSTHKKVYFIGSLNYLIYSINPESLKVFLNEHINCVLDVGEEIQEIGDDWFGTY